MTQCPHCHSSRKTTSRRLQTADLMKIYGSLGIDVSTDLNGHTTLDLERCDDCDCLYFYPVLPGSPAFYEQLMRQTWYYPSEKSEFSFAARLVNPQDSVLEIGCGRGAFAEHIRDNDYTGLEYTDASVNAARERGLNVLRESIEDYVARTGRQHDVVCFFQVLEHVPDVKSFLEAAVACLKPGGLLIISVPSADSFLDCVVNNILNMPPHHVTRWSEKALNSIAERHGLQVMASEKEVLVDEHLVSYLETLALMGLSKRYRETPPLMDLSFGYRLRIRLASRFARWLAPVFSKRSLRPVGHSITFAYRKQP